MSLLDTVHGRYVHQRRVQALLRQIAAVTPQGADVLDLGCGDGLLARALMDARPDLSIRGIDVMARPGALIPVEAFDGYKIPSADKSVDVVMIIDVLHHTEEPAILLIEAARVARKFVLLKDHLNENSFDASTLRFMDWVGNARHGVSLPYNYLSREKWSVAFARAGLAVDRWEGRLGLYPFPASLLFERSLHFLARLVPEAMPAPA